MIRAALPLLAAAVLLTGCAALPQQQPHPEPLHVDAALPSYDQVVAGYNQRVEGLPRLWGRTVGRIWFPDEDGRIQTEQVEGHLQYIAPDRLLLTFNKVGTTYGLMGANEDQYWWIELDRQRRAHVGEHSLVTPQRIAELGLPVYPRDVIELLGVTPLPTDASMADITRADDGRTLIVTTRALPDSQQHAVASVRRLWVDPESFEPRRIEILDDLGRLRIASDLERYETITIPGGGPELPRPRVATEVNVTTADEQTRMRLRASAVEVNRRRPRESIFELDNLIRDYRVTEVISLDEPRAAARD